MCGRVMLPIAGLLVLAAIASGSSSPTAAEKHPECSGDNAIYCEEEDLGCFKIGTDSLFFRPVYRGVNLLPQCGKVKTLELRLNTRHNPLIDKSDTDYLTINKANISGSHFLARRPTKILIHGFMDRCMLPPWTSLMRELLNDGDNNVIRVNWAEANVMPYIQACANLRLVGAYLAKFIHHLVAEHGVDPASVHIIGHSLGAHTAGAAGMYLKQRYNLTLGRITGLDPAGPYFTKMPAEVTLDPTDAARVDTLVTNGNPDNNFYTFGSTETFGHLNFLVNGGRSQPGCIEFAAGTLKEWWIKIRDELTRSHDHLFAVLPTQVPAQSSSSLEKDEEIDLTTKFTAVFLNASSNSLEPFESQFVKAVQEPGRQDTDRKVGLIIPVMPDVMNIFDIFATMSFMFKLKGVDFKPLTYDAGGCSHNRAVVLYTDTIIAKSQSCQSYQCNYDSYEQKKSECISCDIPGNCALLGYYVDVNLIGNTTKDYFSATETTSPFCGRLKLQFQITLTGPPMDGKLHVLIYTASLTKPIGEATVITTADNANYTLNLDDTESLASIKSLGVKWVAPANAWCKIGLCSKITVQQNIKVTDTKGGVAHFRLTGPTLTSDHEIKGALVPE